MKGNHEMQLAESNEIGTNLKLETYLVFEEYFSKFSEVISIYIQMIQS